MSPEASKLVEEFDSSAGDYHWQMDQGSRPESIQNAILNYTNDKEALISFIKSLEQEIKNLKLSTGLVSYQPNLMQYKSITYSTPE